MTLASKFQERRTNRIDLDGQDVFSLYEVDLKGIGTLHVEIVSVDRNVEQGLRLKATKGEMVVNGQAINEAAIWAATAPPQFSVQIPASARKGKLKIWNCWKVDGLDQAWVGNAGMLVVVVGDTITLSCSPGVGEFDPQRMKVQITVQRVD